MTEYMYTPMGARLLVDDIESTVSLEERGKQVGITVIVNQQNRPKVTQGRVIALGDDPMTQARFKVGDIVMFNHLAGVETWIEGRRFRTLEEQEITGRLTPRIGATSNDHSTLPSVPSPGDDPSLSRPMGSVQDPDDGGRNGS